VLRELSDRDRPFATLVTTLYGQQRDSWTRGRGAAVARQFGYSPVELWHRGRLVVAVTLPELDPPEPGVLISGPVWQGTPRPAPPRVDPAVLVSLSTVAQAGQTRVIQRIPDALGALPVRATVTTGRGVDPAALRPPASSRVVQYAQHEKLLPQMSLVISHGGHSTAMAALAGDLPLLLLPMFSLSDQPAVARALADRGAAVTLPKEAGSPEIRTAVETLLGDPAYRTAAAALGAAIRRPGRCGRRRRRAGGRGARVASRTDWDGRAWSGAGPAWETEGRPAESAEPDPGIRRSPGSGGVA
jgi:UDP-N-acetylglucosamine transferase subunit ALG13